MNLDLVIKTIIAIANPVTPHLVTQIKRREIVIKILKKLNLDPEHPPAQFTDVYQHALVEYGVDENGVAKPEAILRLFREEEIKNAFLKAWNANKKSILEEEVDRYLKPGEWNTLQQNIQEEDIDAKQELLEFIAKFIEMVERSRTPAEVRQAHKMDFVIRNLTAIQQDISQLNTLEMQEAIAKLNSLPASTPLLEAANTPQEQCRAKELAEQMRGWLETLGYGFEKYEVWEKDYFEWIVTLQGRRRLERYLIRGVAGEATIGDLHSLGQSCGEQKTDEGWLVAARRVSQAARKEAEKEEHCDLFCYTFDELIDESADFQEYLDWLEEEVKRRGIDRMYVPLACTKEEVHPETKIPVGISRYGEEEGWIDGYVDLWLDDPAKEHLSVLGEFGTGKTWFAFHYAWQALQEYKKRKKRGVERSRLPLVILLRDYAKAFNVENVLAGFFFSQHNIRLSSKVFEQLNRMGKLLLIFDGFDEMAARVDKQQMINNFWELARVLVPGAKAILTCRTEHFPEAKQGRDLLNAELRSSTANLTAEAPQFEVLDLEMFNQEQIRQVLSFRTEEETVEKVMGNQQLLDLARRPVMTEFILEALPAIEAGKPIDISRVYLYAVRQKMERDIKAQRTFTSLADKLYFLCELAWEMLSTNQMSLNYRLFPDRLRRLFQEEVREQKDLDHWHYDMMGQTMLVRNAEGDYSPAHRSLLEFFVAYKFAAELSILAPDFLEVAQQQSHVDNSLLPQKYCWSDYYRREVEATGDIKKIAPLEDFAQESFTHLRQTLGEEKIAKAVLDLLLPMVQVSSFPELLRLLQETRGKNSEAVNYLGGNAASILVAIKQDALNYQNLSNAVIRGANLTNAFFYEANLSGADLTDGVFTKVLGSVFSVALSPDDQLLAAGDSTGIVRILEVATGRELFSYQGHSSSVNSVAWSGDSQMVASGSSDGTVKLWDVKTGQCIKTIDNRPYTDMNITGVKGLTSGQKANLLAFGAVEKEQE